MLETALKSAVERDETRGQDTERAAEAIVWRR
jgi:hypothetical protein